MFVQPPETPLECHHPRKIARLCGVSLRCAQGWRAARSWPLYAQRLARLALDGHLGSMWPAWDGWTVTPGALHWEGVSLPRPALMTYYERLQTASIEREELQRYRAGVPVIDRRQLARLDAAADVLSDAAQALGRLYPRFARRGADAPLHVAEHAGTALAEDGRRV